MFLGYVGEELAVGNVFSSSPPDSIAACARAASSGKGVLLGFGNHTDDVMPFDMAAERVAEEGIQVRAVVTTYDVASRLPGALGTTGNVFVLKVARTACEAMLRSLSASAPRARATRRPHDRCGAPTLLAA